jgi:hypothetical protein
LRINACAGNALISDPGVVLPDLARSQRRIVRLGVASGGHFGDQVADQSGGSVRGSHPMVNHALR